MVVCPVDVELLHLFKSVIAAKWAKTWLLHYNPDKYESIMLATKISSSIPYISYCSACYRVCLFGMIAPYSYTAKNI